ncbi:MAG: putative solute-binding protein [Pseudomonadota bacterium]|nr:putative solute-binding protein [Pseudomonadota bacterium]
MLLSATAQANDKLTLCIYDPLGTRGDAYGFAKDYVLQMPKFGIKKPVELKVYTNEAVVAEDFKAGQCDGAAMSTLRAREFNPFTGSVDSIGAIPSYKHLSGVLQTLARPEMAKYMTHLDYEVVGLIPLGAAYIMVNDRSINTLAKAAGKKIAVLDFDKSQAKLVQQVGAQPVSVDLATIAGAFNNKQVDIIAGPAVIFKPLELHRGMTDAQGKAKGAIIRFPVLQVTATLVVNRKKFNDPAANQKIREYVASQLQTAYNYVDKSEADIPAQYWMDVPATDKPGYQKLMRESRIAMTKDGTYDKTMMSLLKRVRCRFEPTNYECSLNDE